MYFAQNALAVASFMALVRGQGDEKIQEKLSDDDISYGENDKHSRKITEDPTFLALIDIVFTDGQRRTCTGSIIHENVVITAANCFKSKVKKIWPDLTASFITIGNKMMFENGNEQQLPIERVVINPMYKEWTADLALVYTFTSMTKDRPGTIISLAGDKTTFHVDVNLTVLTWGHTAPDEHSDHVESCDSECEDQESDTDCIDDASKEKQKPQEYEELKNRPKTIRSTKSTLVDNRQLRAIYTEAEYETPTSRKHEHKKQIHQHRHLNNPTVEESTIIVSRYFKELGRDDDGYEQLTSRKIRKQEKIKSQRLEHRFEKRGQEQVSNDRAEKQNKKTISRYLKSDDENLEEVSDEHLTKQESLTGSEVGAKSSLNGRRRSEGLQKNILLIESFSFISYQKCRNLVEKISQDAHDISTKNDAICYTSTDLFITDADAGAPAIRGRKLVAVTVGGVNYEGERAAVGMKMSCYCSWIADNLPKDAPALNCCKNCCDVKHKETVKPHGYRLRNMYLL